MTRYELTPDQVDCVVFCSKNYAPILPHINSITERFHTYFHYTITAYGKEIEPGVPGTDEHGHAGKTFGNCRSKPHRMAV